MYITLVDKKERFSTCLIFLDISQPWKCLIMLSPSMKILFLLLEDLCDSFRDFWCCLLFFGFCFCSFCFTCVLQPNSVVWCCSRIGDGSFTRGSWVCWFQKQLFANKETPTQVFSCEYCEVFKNSFFIEHLWWLLLWFFFCFFFCFFFYSHLIGDIIPVVACGDVRSLVIQEWCSLTWINEAG